MLPIRLLVAPAALLAMAGTASAINPCHCVGYTGIGGVCYAGVGGPAFAGPGGPAYAGPGGPCSPENLTTPVPTTSNIFDNSGGTFGTPATAAGGSDGQASTPANNFFETVPSAQPPTPTAGSQASPTGSAGAPSYLLPQSPATAGPGTLLYSGLGGPCYAGIGGPCFFGQGGTCPPQCQ